MNYGNYNKPYSDNFQQSVKPKQIDSKSEDSKKELNPSDPKKTSEASQSIMSKSPSQPTKQLKDIKITPQAESTDVVLPKIQSQSTILINNKTRNSKELAEMKEEEMNVQPIDSSLQINLERIENMSEVELIKIFNEHFDEISPLELDRIEERILEFEDKTSNKKTKEKSIEDSVSNKLTNDMELTDEEVQTFKKTQVEVSYISLEGHKLLKNRYLPNPDGSLRQLTFADLSDTRNFEHLFEKNFEFDPITRVLRPNKENAKNFKMGDTIKVQGEDGKYYNHKITKVEIASEEEINKFRTALISYQNSLNPTPHEEEHAHSQESSAPKFRSTGNNSEPLKEKTKENERKTERSITSGAQSQEGVSIKKFNDKRIRDLIKYLDEKLKIIKNKIEREEIQSERIKSEDTSRTVKDSSFTQKELATNTLKLDVRYKEVLQNFRDTANKMQIPLATVEGFEEFITEFEKIERMVPSDSNPKLFEVHRETFRLKTELVKKVSTMLTLSGTKSNAGTEHASKTASPAA